MRVAAAQREAQAEAGDELRWHEPEEIGACALAEPRGAGEGVLGADGPAGDVRPLDDTHVETGAPEDRRRHEPVVAGAEHDDVVMIWHEASCEARP